MYIVIGRNDTATTMVECDTATNTERCAVILLLKEGCDTAAVVDEGETLAMYRKGEGGVEGVGVGDLCVLPNSRRVYGVSHIDMATGTFTLKPMYDRRYPKRREQAK